MFPVDDVIMCFWFCFSQNGVFLFTLQLDVEEQHQAHLFRQTCQSGVPGGHVTANAGTNQADGGIPAAERKTYAGKDSGV